MVSRERTGAPVIVVTGAARGIGAAVTRLLAGGGYRVVAGVRRAEDADALREECGDAVVPALLDITDPAAVASAAELVAGEVGDGGLAGLVNNAGVAVAAPLEFLPPDDLRRQLDVNVVGQHAVTQALLPLIRRGGGRIVTIGSIGDRFSSPMMGPYHASKFALRALTDALRMELKPWGIEVVLIEPGAVATPIWETSIAAADRLREALPARALELYGRAIDGAVAAARQTAARGIQPEVVARAVLRALTVRRPRPRYLVGTDARITAVIAALPDRLRERLIMRVAEATSRGDTRTTPARLA
jgi:NAD(P)-dependent dehydrogenase (short-subunit alcohol dehydrogenase family)